MKRMPLPLKNFRHMPLHSSIIYISLEGQAEVCKFNITLEVTP